MKKIFIPILFLVLLFSPLRFFGSGDPFSQTKFVPAISFIMDVSYLNRGLDGLEADGFEIPGFLHSGHSDGHSHSESVLMGERGFNFNYAELSLFATVDPYFDLFTAFHLGADHFEVEEAYVTTRKLPHGFGMKIGKFLSSIGRANNQHAHTWNFQEIPLVYRVFFGEEGLNELGVQLNWVAPTDFFLTLGCEILQGENQASFGLDSEEFEESDLEEVKPPALVTLFAKSSADIGDLVVLGGVSYASGETRTVREEEEGEHLLAGRTEVFGFDLTLKYLLDSYRYVSLQSEYITRSFEGDWVEEGVIPFIRNQAGFYSELVFRFSKLWRAAARLEMLFKNDIKLDGAGENLPEDLKRYSVMVDYTPTEFSRIRLQYNHNQHLYYNGDLKQFGELNLQLNIAVGAHGAHPF